MILPCTLLTHLTHFGLFVGYSVFACSMFRQSITVNGGLGNIKYNHLKTVDSVKYSYNSGDNMSQNYNQMNFIQINYK